MKNEISKQLVNVNNMVLKHEPTQPDFNRLLKEHIYAERLLNGLEAFDDEALLLLCISLNSRFRHLAMRRFD